MMIPYKEGQIVRFHTVFEDEDPLLLYMTLWVGTDSERPRAAIYAINSGLPWPPINVVRLGDLEVVD